METVKRTIRLALATLLIAGTLSAEFEDNLGEEQLIQPAQIPSLKPFAILADYDWIGKSHFSDTPFNNQEIGFSQGDAAFRFPVAYNPRCKEGILGEVGYSYTNIGWNDNPFFNQHNFNTFNAAVTLFTERLDCWLWTFRFSLGYDTCRRDFWEATVYDILLWGRYTFNCHWGAHFGFLALTGMRIDNVYPIIGFDWKPNDRWEVNVVYPVDISLVYHLNCNWSLAGAARFWNSRFRLGPDEPIPNGLLVYRNNGVEAAAIYKYSDWFKADVHAGYTVGGQLKVANQQYQNKMHFDFDSAPYIGGEVEINF